MPRSRDGPNKDQKDNKKTDVITVTSALTKKYV